MLPLFSREQNDRQRLSDNKNTRRHHRLHRSRGHRRLVRQLARVLGSGTRQYQPGASRVVGHTGNDWTPLPFDAAQSGDDVYIRAAEIDPVPGYKPLTTYGWGSFELVIEDVYALNERLLKGPFQIIGPPQSIGPDYPTIHAMQVVGPSQEVLYLTCDIGDPAKSLLPRAGAAVGRDFIMVLSGLADVSIAHDFYVEKFHMEPGEPRQTAVGIIADALGLPEGEGLWMTFIPFRHAANFLEIDGYPSPAAKPRPVNEGQLPPGCALASFGVEALSDIDVEWLGPAAVEASMNYAGKPSAALRGPAGEIIELIEESS